MTGGLHIAYYSASLDCQEGALVLGPHQRSLNCCQGQACLCPHPLCPGWCIHVTTGDNSRSLTMGVVPPSTDVIPTCWLKAASVPAKSIEQVNDDLLQVRMGRIAVTAMEDLLLIGLG